MNAYGFPPKEWCYLVALELSEVLGHVRPARSKQREFEVFAAEAWRLVGRLGRLGGTRKVRSVPETRAMCEGLRAKVVTLGLRGNELAVVAGKLDEVLGALDEAVG